MKRNNGIFLQIMELFENGAYDGRFENVDEAVIKNHFLLLHQDGYVVGPKFRESGIKDGDIVTTDLIYDAYESGWSLTNKGYNQLEYLREHIDGGIPTKRLNW